MEISRIRRVSVPVSDQDRAKDFYVGALGFELVGDDPIPVGENARWLEVAPEGAQTSLILVNWFDGVAPGSVQGLMLETADVESDCERLRSAGVSVEGPHEMPWAREATFTDPDGNGIVLSELMPASS